LFEIALEVQFDIVAEGVLILESVAFFAFGSGREYVPQENARGRFPMQGLL